MKEPLYASMKLAIIHGNDVWPAEITNPKQWSRCFRWDCTWYYLLRPTLVAWFYRRCRSLKKDQPANYAILAPRFKALYQAAFLNWSLAERGEFKNILDTGMAVSPPRPLPDWMVEPPFEPLSAIPKAQRADHQLLLQSHAEFFTMKADTPELFVYFVGRAILRKQKIPPLAAKLYRVYKEQANPVLVRNLKRKLGWPQSGGS